MKFSWFYVDTILQAMNAFWWNLGTPLLPKIVERFLVSAKWSPFSCPLLVVNNYQICSLHRANNGVLCVGFTYLLNYKNMFLCSINNLRFTIILQKESTQCWLKQQFSVPQIEYPLVGSSKKGSHVYFLLMVAMVLLLWRPIVLLWHQNNIYIGQEYNLTKQ